MIIPGAEGPAPKTPGLPREGTTTPGGATVGATTPGWAKVAFCSPQRERLFFLTGCRGSWSGRHNDRHLIHYYMIETQ